MTVIVNTLSFFIFRRINLFFFYLNIFCQKLNATFVCFMWDFALTLCREESIYVVVNHILYVTANVNVLYLNY